ncbi:hypothetical protein Ndes2526A_g00999 [Nannochloris sp. 'desiccata']|nr:hypothetical protein KSW81_002164 [Chlorella desiccata (nom. nud.)]
MTDDGEVIPPGQGEVAADAADVGEIAKQQWESAMAAFGKTTAMAAGAPFMPGGVPYTLPFPPPYMLPGLMQFGLNPFFQAAAAYGADLNATAGKQDANPEGGIKSENKGNGQEGASTAPPPSADTLKRRPSRTASLPQKKAKPAEENRAVRSQSQAALALLAHAAGDVFPSSSDLQEPPPSQKTDETLPASPPRPAPAPGSQEDANRGGHVNPMNRKMSIDVSIGAGDDDLSLLNTAGLDEKELKKLRRKQSNRESARRSRLKKQDECDTLQRENRHLRNEIQQLLSDKIELTAQVAILNAKLTMSGVLGVFPQQQQQQPSAPPQAAMAATMAAAAAAAAATGGTLPQSDALVQNETTKPEDDKKIKS